MISLQNRAGERFEIPGLDETGAATIAPALASGWMLGTVQPVPTFTPIGASPVTDAPKERKVRVPKPLAAPPPDVLDDMTALLAKQGDKGLTKMGARSHFDALGTDVVDGCLEWMQANGRATKTAKTYRPAVAA